MSPSRRDPLEDARRRLDEAAGALDGMRRIVGEGGEPVDPVASVSESVRREALAAARDDLRRIAGDLEAERARTTALHTELGRLRAELADRPTELRLEEARTAAALDANSRAEELARQVVVLQERVSLLNAEHVRLETLRRKAENFGANADASRKSLEDTLRRDLRAAHGALDRAAAEAGAREAKAVSEVEDMRKRLDTALHRIHREETARKQELAEAPALRADYEAAQAVIAALRKELSETRAEVMSREAAEGLRGDFDAAEAVIASLRKELSVVRAAAVTRERELEKRVTELQSPVIPPAGLEEDGGAALPEIEYPSIEYALEPGWARLLHLVKPPLQAAYGHLRRLSTGPMSPGQRAILRLTGASLSQAADALATIELALSEGPATVENANVLSAVEGALNAWDPVLRRRGIVLTRVLPTGGLPDSPHDPDQLRLMLHHAIRNAVEALPRGATFRVLLKKASAGVELEFRDDGPGYPAAWLERRFEPFISPRKGHAGLGLAAVRRALLRWGGDASAANGPSGRGACLIWTFAAPPARPAGPK